MAKATTPKPKPEAPAAEAILAAGLAAPETAATPSPIPASPQASEPTGAVEVSAATAAASVDPKPDASVELEVRGPKGYGVKVVGPAQGRWRIGRKFGPEAIVIPAPELTEAQMEALYNDPSLICSAGELSEIEF